jgi:hypothetical protein
MKFFSAINEEQQFLAEAKVENVINFLKNIEQEEKSGMFKKVKTFPEAKLKKLFSEMQFINGASLDTFVPMLKRAGFSDEQISKVKPYFVERIKATEKNRSRIHSDSEAQRKTSPIRKDSKATGYTG